VAPRTILYTGKGGVGKTSVAAAAARRCAAAGLRTVVLSTDPAHSLSDSLEAELGADPTQAGPNLFGQEVQAQEEMERHWDSVQTWLGSLLEERGVDRIAAEELTVPPGMDELFSLLWIKRHYEEGGFDCVIVDCAPTGETLRLLSFPDVVTWWLERILPSQRRLAPFARSLFDIPLPGDGVFEDVERLARNLVAMNGILRDRAHTTVRLVINPDRMVVKEAMRTFTYLNLYGYLTDAVVVNRLLPADGYFAAWSEVQREQLDVVRSAFEPVPVLTAPYLEREVVGPEMLDRLGDEVFGERDAAAVLHSELAHELVTENGRATLRVDVPFAQKGDLGLKKIGLEVVVRVGAQKRTIMLPPALAAYAARGARLDDGTLEISFERARPEALGSAERAGDGIHGG
jgi:arsenite/tail-anchored protein-transporting ATPase